MSATTDHRGPLTYAEAFALLARGGWRKLDEHNNYLRDGRHCYTLETWTRPRLDGPEWCGLHVSPCQGDTRGWWHLRFGNADPRGMLPAYAVRGQILPLPPE